MRKPEEIMSDADNRPSIKILGMMEYDSAIKAIKQAQKEAYNEAIRDAGNKLQQTAGQWNSDFALQRRIFDLLKP